MTYLVNLSEKDYARKKNKWSVPLVGLSIHMLTNIPHRLPKIKAWIDANNPGDPLIPFSVALEDRLAALEGEELAAAEKEAGATSNLGKITTAGYSSLDVCIITEHELALSLTHFLEQLIRYFTCGPEETRAWTIRKGTKAPQAAGVIQ